MSTIIYKCPACDGPLKFNAAAQKFTCEYCDSSFLEPELKKILEERIEKEKQLFGESALEKELNGGSAEPAASSESAAEFDEGEMRAYTCPSCAAEIVTDTNTAATFCAFCHNPTILPSRLSGDFKPEKVIPFAVDKKAAETLLHQYIKKKPLIPKGFTAQSNLEKITGVYVPFWLFDCRSDGQIVFEAKNVKTWSSGNYRYTKTDIYHAFREGCADFALVPADGAEKFDDQLMDAIEPFDYSKIVDFSTAYLSGFYAEKYDVSKDESLPRVSKRCHKQVQSLMTNTVSGYSSVKVLNNALGLQNVTDHYALLPVWMLTYQYQGKDYLFAVNGQSGKMAGNLPVSFSRAALWFASIAGIGLALSAIIFLLMTLL